MVTVPEFGGRQTLRFTAVSTNVRLEVQSDSLSVFGGMRWCEPAALREAVADDLARAGSRYIRYP